MSSERGLLVRCPVVSCVAFAMTSGDTDPGLIWLFHVRDRHPELVYSPGQIERRRLERAVKARAN